VVDGRVEVDVHCSHASGAQARRVERTREPERGKVRKAEPRQRPQSCQPESLRRTT
jgi:hypothetical protein